MTVKSGSRLSSWGTTPIRARTARPAAGIASPSTVSSPPLGGEWPRIMRSVVVLPAPFGPSSPKQPPRGTRRSMPSTTVFAP